MSIADENEISRIWRGSKKDWIQIKILADLNDCEVSEIEEVLMRHGHEIPERRGNTKKQRALPKEEPVSVTASLITDQLDKRIKVLRQRIKELEQENEKKDEELKRIYHYVLNMNLYKENSL